MRTSYGASFTPVNSASTGSEYGHAWGVNRLRSDPPLLGSDGPIGELAFRFCRMLLRTSLFPWFRVRYVGEERLRRPGAFIIAPVHRSHLDGPLVGSLTHRKVRYLGKESLFRPPILGWFMKSFGSFPVKRGTADLGAMKVGKRLLDNGDVMLVFPEGGRQPVGDIDEMFDGAAWLSAKTKVPVVPVGITGTGEAMAPGVKIPKRTQVALVVGEAMDMPTAADGGPATREDMRAWTRQLKANLQECQRLAKELAER